MIMNKKENIIQNLKNFIKTRKISRLTIIIICVAVVLIIISIILFRLNFLIGEQLRMTLTPEYSESAVVSPGNVSFIVDTKLYNKFVCDAVCNYTLTDISHNILLDSGSFHSKAYNNKEYSVNIPVTYLGYGINTYLYRLECTNIRTAVCPSNNDLLVRKSLLVVNYTPSIEQTSAADFSMNNYARVSENLINSSRILVNSKYILDNVNLSFDKTDYVALHSEITSLSDNLQNVLSVWSNDDYISAKSLLVSNNLLDRSTSILSRAFAYNTYLLDSINNHNSLLTELRIEYFSEQALRTILLYNLLNLTSISDSVATNNLVNIAHNISNNINIENSLITSFNHNNYNYTSFYSSVLKLHNSTRTINSILIDSTHNELIDSYPALYIYSNIFCAMEDNSPSNVVNSSNSSSGNFSNSSVSDNSYASYNSSSVSYTFCGHNYNTQVITIEDASNRLNAVCQDSSHIVDNLKAYDLANYSSNDDSKDTLLMQYKLIIDYESLNGETPLVSSYRTYILNALLDKYNISNPEILINLYPFNSSVSSALNSSLFKFNSTNLLLLDIEQIKEQCYNTSNSQDISTIPSINTITAEYYSIPVFNASNLSNIDSYNSDILSVPSLPPIVPQCCMYGKCQSCDKKPSKNPLILLHGHSFNKNTYAYQSIEIFNGFEAALSYDKLYFQTGSVKVANSTYNALGHYYIPVVVKPTYYLETYNDLLGLTVSESKTGNIDTYALRLKELIDYTKYVTGSDKVDIVAHSMGGLVVRRYMQVFGTQSIGTVILVATPNQGITGSTYTLCKILGSSNECEDMKSDGLFIKKLNDLSDQPDIKNMYLVVGRGCDTDGVQGDGVVNVNNALIPNLPKSHILYVNGTCSGTNLLHNNLLNVDEYPQVYKFVKETLGK